MTWQTPEDHIAAIIPDAALPHAHGLSLTRAREDAGRNRPPTPVLKPPSPNKLTTSSSSPPKVCSRKHPPTDLGDVYKGGPLMVPQRSCDRRNSIVLLTCDIHRNFICLLPWSIIYSEDNAHYWEQSSNQPDWLEQL